MSSRKRCTWRCAPHLWRRRRQSERHHRSTAPARRHRLDPFRHEEAAAFAAGAEAHLTGELAVCAGSCGPGNLHLINGLFDCHRSRVPVLAIAAHIPSAEIGRGYFQETHRKRCSASAAITANWCRTPQLPGRPRSAIRAAIGHRGVAVVVIPGDIALQSMSARSPPAARSRSASRSWFRRRAISMRWPNCSTRARGPRCCAAVAAPVRMTHAC